MAIKPVKPITSTSTNPNITRETPKVRTGGLEKTTNQTGLSFQQELDKASRNLEENRTIVLIEDTLLAKFFYNSIREEIPFVNVRSFLDGDSFYKEIDIGLEFDMAIVDLSLPGKIAGDDVIKRIHSINPYTPIISMSGYNLYQNPFIKEHLWKPLWEKDLIPKIKKYLL